MNWIEYTKSEDLLVEFTSKLANDLSKEAGHDFNELTEEQCQEIGSSLTAAWFDGKTSDEVVDYLVKKYGTEAEKKSYNEWLIERA
jgi:hypothetical protein